MKHVGTRVSVFGALFLFAGSLVLLSFALAYQAMAAGNSISSSLGVIPYPTKGQTSSHQNRDEGECYAWAKEQTKEIIGPKRTTAIRLMEMTDGQLTPQGFEFGMGWTVGIDRTSGKMMATLQECSSRADLSLTLSAAADTLSRNIAAAGAFPGKHPVET